MTEQEKNDQEQLEYLKQWQERKKQKSKKTNVFRKILRKRKRRRILKAEYKRSLTRGDQEK